MTFLSDVFVFYYLLDTIFPQRHLLLKSRFHEFTRKCTFDVFLNVAGSHVVPEFASKDYYDLISVLKCQSFFRALIGPNEAPPT